LTRYREERSVPADDTWDFETTPIDFDELAVELLGWIGEFVHVHVEHGSGAGATSFDGRLDRVVPGFEESTVILWFRGNVAYVALNPDVMKAFRVTSPGSESRWLEFRVGSRQLLELALDDPGESWRRQDQPTGAE
jgi:hypothetical protein